MMISLLTNICVTRPQWVNGNPYTGKTASLQWSIPQTSLGSCRYWNISKTFESYYTTTAPLCAFHVTMVTPTLELYQGFITRVSQQSQWRWGDQVLQVGGATQQEGTNSSLYYAAEVFGPWETWQKFYHDDVIKWKHFPQYWPFVQGIHRWPVNSPHKGQWRGALMFSLIIDWINSWVNNC